MLKFIKKFFELKSDMSNVKTLDKPCPNCRGVLHSELISTLEYGWTNHVWCTRCKFVGNYEPKI